MAGSLSRALAVLALLSAAAVRVHGAPCTSIAHCTNCTAGGLQYNACSRGFFTTPTSVPPSNKTIIGCKPCNLDGCLECAPCRRTRPDCVDGRRCTRCAANYALSPAGGCTPNAPVAPPAAFATGRPGWI
ncbi:hypothetical protein ABPG75_007090 [Micractinium tetrahymenae]